MRYVLVLLLLCFFGKAVVAGEWSGFIAAEERVFFRGAQFDGQDSSGASLIAEPEYYHEFDNGDDSLIFVPYLRLDQHDDRRTHFDIRELNWLHVGDGWELRAGIGKVFWGVTEVRHLVNIVNQDDLVEDIDGEDKLGQPMIDVGFFEDWGNLRFFVLPGFRERTFPGTEGRLRSGIVVDDEIAVFESSKGEQHIDFAARYSHVIDEWDFGISQFWGTSREPRLVLNSAGDALVPHYDIISQTGIDIQATYDAWLWKFEGIYREGHDQGFAATVLGLEYTFFDVEETGADIGLLTEYLWDDRRAGAPGTQLDQDMFFGTRLALNDVQSTELLAGGTVDLNNASLGFLAEFSRRIGDSVKLEIDGRLFTNTDPKELFFDTRNDDHVQLRLSKYF